MARDSRRSQRTGRSAGPRRHDARAPVEVPEVIRTGPRPTTRELFARVRLLAEPIAEGRGCEVVAVETVSSVAARRVLRVSVDRPGGATIEDCTRISRALSPALDAEDLVDVAYDLEVSTPGIDRPVQRAEDFVRFAGCDVRIKTWGMDGRRRLKARILGCEDGVVHLQTDGGPRDVAVDDIERANLVLTFEQFHRLGQGLHPAEGDTTP